MKNYCSIPFHLIGCLHRAGLVAGLLVSMKMTKKKNYTAHINPQYLYIPDL